MSKKKASSRPPLPDTATERLRDARDYAARQRWEEAAEILEALNQRHPKRPEILSPLTDVYAGLGEVVQMLDTAETWRQVAPRAPGALHALLRAYASLNYLVHTWRAGQQFVREFPDDSRAEVVRAITAAAETDLQEPLPDLNVTVAEGIELAEWHERARLAMLRNRYPEAQRLCETLLAKYPTFAPALNNLALLHHVAGRLDDATAITRRVLELTPDNVHALANLTHYHMMRADVDAARETAARLRASTAEAADRAVKIAEALGFVGDDAGLLELVRETEATPHPFILRLGGVAAWRLGRSNEALALWQAAQRLDPDDELVRDALTDLKRPVGYREGPTAFPLQEWVSYSVVQELQRAVERVRGEAAIQAAARSVVERHPYLERLAPLLLERVGKAGREYVLGLAGLAQTPALLEAVRDFALGQHGSDRLRLQAAQLATRYGALATGTVRMWMEGAWHDTLMLGMQLHGEPLHPFPHSREVMKWMKAAAEAAGRDDQVEAERLLRLALRAEPDQPDLLNNLAGVYSATGRRDQAEAVIRAVFARDPDYLFGRTNLARLLAQQGQLAEAQALLDALYARRSMHYTEFASFCSAQIEVLLGRQDRAAARQWLALWEQADPENPLLAHFRERVGRGPTAWYEDPRGGTV